MVKILKNISDIIIGHVFRSKIKYTSNGNVNLLNMDVVSTTGLVSADYDDVKRVVVADLKSDEIIKPGDILFKAKGLNNSAVLINDIPDNTTVTASCCIIRVFDSKFSPEYVCAWLNGAKAKRHFSKGAGQIAGVTIANVSKATLESLEIPIIPMNVQKLISGIGELAKQEKELMLKIADKKEILSHAIVEKELCKY